MDDGVNHPHTADDPIWKVRSFIYSWLVEHERPPTAGEAAADLSIGLDDAERAYHRLHQLHAILLAADNTTIRMANPFSGVPTGFRVQVNGHSYWANCAWDALGIPAALGVVDARIEAICADSQTPVTLVVEGGSVRGGGALVHFPLPFRQWYDDLART